MHERDAAYTRSIYQLCRCYVFFYVRKKFSFVDYTRICVVYHSPAAYTHHFAMLVADDFSVLRLFLPFALPHRDY